MGKTVLQVKCSVATGAKFTFPRATKKIRKGKENWEVQKFQLDHSTKSRFRAFVEQGFKVKVNKGGGGGGFKKTGALEKWPATPES